MPTKKPQRKTRSQMKFAWHIHHAILVEPLTDTISTRRKVIVRCKPKHEVAIRLHLLKFVTGKLPRAVTEAQTTVQKATRSYERCRDLPFKRRNANYYCKKNTLLNSMVKAKGLYHTTIADNMAAIYELHAQECPRCPWDGHHIFGKGWKDVVTKTSSSPRRKAKT